MPSAGSGLTGAQICSPTSASLCGSSPISSSVCSSAPSDSAAGSSSSRQGAADLLVVLDLGARVGGSAPCGWRPPATGARSARRWHRPAASPRGRVARSCLEILLAQGLAEPAPWPRRRRDLTVPSGSSVSSAIVPVGLLLEVGHAHHLRLFGGQRFQGRPHPFVALHPLHGSVGAGAPGRGAGRGHPDPAPAAVRGAARRSACSGRSGTPRWRRWPGRGRRSRRAARP